MFDTENEIENSGVENEASQEPVESQPDASQGQESQQAAAPAPKEVPFHEHPRWKEVMEERNTERQARAQLEQQLQQMQRQFQEAQKPKDTRPDFNEVRAKMAERLKGIDPEFQSYMGMVEEQALAAKQELAAFREEQFVNRAVSRFEELTKTDGVPQEVVSLYKAQLDQAYREGKIRNLQDLESTYKQIHEPFNKMLEAREKAYLEKYTASKKQAASKPSAQPKGKSATPGQAPKAQTKASMIADVVAQLRAEKNPL